MEVLWSAAVLYPGMSILFFFRVSLLWISDLFLNLLAGQSGANPLKHLKTSMQSLQISRKKERKKDSVFPQALNSYTCPQLLNEQLSLLPSWQISTSLACRTGAILLRFSLKRKAYVERETRATGKGAVIFPYLLRARLSRTPRPLCVHPKNTKKKNSACSAGQHLTG